MAAALAALGLAAAAWPATGGGAVEPAARLIPTAALAVPVPQQVHSRRGPMRETRTGLVALASAPFPYDGLVPATRKPFLEVFDDGRRGRRAGHSRIYWEDETYSDARVLLHIPKGFDARRPGMIVVFFHGHGATIEEDVYARQQVPRQLTRSGANVVLVAPQLAVKAADSSAGKLWRPGGLKRLIDEAAPQLAGLYGDQRAATAFASMPVTIVAYSGGYVPAAWSVHHGGLGQRLRGVVLLDALYGELDKFTEFILNDGSAFFVSAYTDSTRRRNELLREALAARGLPIASSLGRRLEPGALAFVDTGSERSHRDFVTEAWAPLPVSDLLARLPAGYRRP